MSRRAQIQCTFSNIIILSKDFCNQVAEDWEYLITGLDWITGLDLDWTTGLMNNVIFKHNYAF